jgi:hypothetical protein
MKFVVFAGAGKAIIDKAFETVIDSFVQNKSI